MAAGGSARTTRTVPAGKEASRWRTRARRRRVTVLRTTAPPTALLTTNPALGTSPVGSTKRWTTNCEPALRRPRRTAALKSALRRTRFRLASTICPIEVGQAESSERPLRRRAERMERPARVRIRSRNPCVLARRRLFGWKVRLLTRMLQEGRWVVDVWTGVDHHGRLRRDDGRGHATTADTSAVPKVRAPPPTGQTKADNQDRRQQPQPHYAGSAVNPQSKNGNAEDANTPDCTTPDGCTVRHAALARRTRFVAPNPRAQSVDDGVDDWYIYDRGDPSRCLS